MKLDILEFENRGVVHTYKKKLWVQDEFHEDGGYYLYVDQTYENPMIDVVFKARLVDEKIPTGTISKDKLGNTFLSTTEDTIVLAENHVNQFSIPDSIIHAYRAFQE